VPGLPVVLMGLTGRAMSIDGRGRTGVDRMAPDVCLIPYRKMLCTRTTETVSLVYNERTRIDTSCTLYHIIS
jgi:hypothetical protein